jgi:serine/threonine protein kinase
MSMSPTITSPAMTQAGMLLGTATYMSPEQAKGRPADRRSDLWTFGAVLFEMLTGQRAFPGEDVIDTIVAVVTRTPEWHLLPAGTPMAIRRLLERCLEKDRKRRLDSATAARLEIDEAIGSPETTSIRDIAALRVVRQRRAPRMVCLHRSPSPGRRPGGDCRAAPPRSSAARVARNARRCARGEHERPDILRRGPRRSLDRVRRYRGRVPRLWLRPLNAATAHPLPS